MHYSLFTFLNAGITDFKTIKEAETAYEAKAYTKSAALLNSLEGKSAELEYDIGNANYKSKNYDAAIKSYQKAKGVDKATRLHNVGNSYFQKKDLEKAIKSYEEALKIREDKDTRFNLELAKKKKRVSRKKRKIKKRKKIKRKKVTKTSLMQKKSKNPKIKRVKNLQVSQKIKKRKKIKVKKRS